MERRFRDAVGRYMGEFEEDLAKLVACRSVRDAEHARTGAPFGPGIEKAFEVFLGIAVRCGFTCRNLEGYACEAQAGNNGTGEYIGILGHLDVVEEGDRALWETDPFRLTEKDGIWYARGASDDKGPLLAALYAVRILKDMGMEFKRNVRVIAGGAEETTWECMDYYFRKNAQPVMGFSPDGNFPIVNGEKGILKYVLKFPSGNGAKEHPQLACATMENYVCDRVTARLKEEGEWKEYLFEGVRALSRNPQRGENALWKLADFMSGRGLPAPAERFTAFMRECMTDDFYGQKSGLYSSDPQMGQTSVCPTGAAWEEDGIRLYLDIRYPKSVTREQLGEKMNALGKRFGFLPEASSEKKLLYVPEESELIRKLKAAYETVMGQEAYLFTKGGASYARTLRRGIAFGAAFDGEDTRPHMPNEGISAASLQKAMEIYCEAVAALAGMCQELPQ